jgi:hypothetical protein
VAGPAVTSGAERAGPLVGQALPLVYDSATVSFLCLQVSGLRPALKDEPTASTTCVG